MIQNPLILWVGLTTTYKEEDDKYYYYDVELDSFSYFAIAIDLTGTGIVCIPKRTKCVDDNLQQCSSDGKSWKFLETCDYGCKNNKCISVLKGIIYYIVISVMSMGILVIIYFGHRHFSKKRLEKNLEATTSLDEQSI